MKYEEKPWLILKNSNYNVDYELSGTVITIICLAKDYFIKITNNKYSLDNYEIEIQLLSENFLSISFIPNVDNYIDGIPFEIAVNGQYKNGQGYTFIYDLQTKNILDVIGMR
ncbi:hypothetical protein [Capnocytophaga sp.]|uniref:hypothetical protein n=1 Tax=Capnocytophaga sp. TaxID=44737 RepID=UPI0026DC793D|nr:hypothetical protein [Capnocytophaga sp.]MDO5106077.1 hypothetical protein [Capnocytophaga sp.]